MKKIYLMDLYDIDCTMKAEKNHPKKFKGIIVFPNGSSCTALMKNHTFCEATVLKVTENKEYYDEFLAANDTFLQAQTIKRNRLDIFYRMVNIALLATLFLVIFSCIVTSKAMILLAFLLIWVYKYYIFPKNILLFLDRHLALIVNHPPKSNEN